RTCMDWGSVSWRGESQTSLGFGNLTTILSDISRGTQQKSKLQHVCIPRCPPNPSQQTQDAHLQFLFEPCILVLGHVIGINLGINLVLPNPCTGSCIVSWHRYRRTVAGGQACEQGGFSGKQILCSQDDGLQSCQACPRIDILVACEQT